MTSTADLAARLSVAITDLKIIGDSIPVPAPDSALAAQAISRESRSRMSIARFDTLAARASAASPLRAFHSQADDLATAAAEALGQTIAVRSDRVGAAVAAPESAALPDSRGSVSRRVQ